MLADFVSNRSCQLDSVLIYGLKISNINLQELIQIWKKSVVQLPCDGLIAEHLGKYESINVSEALAFHITINAVSEGSVAGLLGQTHKNGNGSASEDNGVGSTGGETAWNNVLDAAHSCHCHIIFLPDGEKKLLFEMSALVFANAPSMLCGHAGSLPSPP